MHTQRQHHKDGRPEDSSTGVASSTISKDLEGAKASDTTGTLSKVLPDQLAAEVSAMQQHMLQLLENDSTKAVIEPDFGAWLKAKKQSELSETLLSSLQQIQAGGAVAAGGAAASGGPVTYELFSAPSAANRCST